MSERHYIRFTASKSVVRSDMSYKIHNHYCNLSTSENMRARI